jgi:DNA-binding LacI/PurR family transcriptional regulator
MRSKPINAPQPVESMPAQTGPAQTGPVLTMDDIARLAGVAKSTVSRALAGSAVVAADTRERVRQIAEQHGYVINTVASGLRLRRTRTIAVVILLRHDAQQSISDPFFMEMLAHLADCLAARGYDLLLSKITAPSSSWIQVIERSRKVDGVILIGQSLEHAQISAAASGGMPVVVWGAKMKGQTYITVGTDNREGGRMAALHLIARNRRAIAFVGDCRVPEVRQRHAGYLAALKAAGIIADSRLVVPSLFEPEDALLAIRRLIDSGAGFDGIVAASDVIAMAAIQALSAAGRRVPEDVAVTGFDDIAMAAHATPPLTTIRQDIARGAALLTEFILDRVDGKAPRSIEMEPELVVRGST